MSKASETIAPATAARKTTGKKHAEHSPRIDAAARQAVTLDSIARLAPDAEMMTKLYRLFGLDPINSAEITETTKATLLIQAKQLTDALTDSSGDPDRADRGDRALIIHMQRITGAYVGSAYGAARFFDNKRQQARDMASKLNEDRDEDRTGPLGFEDKVQRAQAFAADMALQAYAMHATAVGAVAAFEQATGTTWKPYVPNTPESQSTSRQAALARDNAFA